jgi:hypothetical protein
MDRKATGRDRCSNFGVWPLLCLGDLRMLPEKCTPPDLASRNKFNRAVARGRNVALGEEDTRRGGSFVPGPTGGPRKLVLVGISTADEG